MIVIIGLGNPEKTYENTYHNMGFMALDYFAKKNDLEFTKEKYNGLIATGLVEGEKVMLIKPTTYMNLSGKSVRAVVSGLKLPLENLLVIYDDIDMPVGTVRLRKEGSAGTHNGMRSIVSELGSTCFSRIRIGIGRDARMDLASYVLSKVSKENLEILNAKFDDINNKILEFIKKKGKIEATTI